MDLNLLASCGMLILAISRSRLSSSLGSGLGSSARLGTSSCAGLMNYLGNLSGHVGNSGKIALVRSPSGVRHTIIFYSSVGHKGQDGNNVYSARFTSRFPGLTGLCGRGSMGMGRHSGILSVRIRRVSNSVGTRLHSRGVS